MVKIFYSDDDELSCTFALHYAVLQYLLHPVSHVRDILGYSLDPLHQAGWLKPADKQQHINTE